MPIYKGRTKGTHRVVVWAKGRRHDYTVKGTRADAKAFEARQRVALDAGSVSSTRVAPTLLAFCAGKYRPHAEAHLAASTWKKVRHYQVITLCDHLGGLKLTEIDAEAIEKYKATRRLSIGASSVNNELRVLRTIVNWARTLGYPTNVSAWKRLPVSGPPRVRVWSAEEVQRMYAAASAVAPELLDVLVFLVNTGCRKGEAIAAEWDWVDFKARLLRIPVNDYWRPKNGMPREVPLGDAVLAMLKRRHAAEGRHERWVFPTRHGGRYAEFPKDLFARVREAASVKGGPHAARHTYASHFLQKVPEMFLLGQVLGHSQQRVTELYTHLLPGHLLRARNAVDLAPVEKNRGKDRGKRARTC